RESRRAAICTQCSTDTVTIKRHPVGRTTVDHRKPLPRLAMICVYAVIFRWSAALKEPVMTAVRVFLLLMFTVIAQAAQAITGEKAEFKEVADDVYAFVGKLNDANALVVVTAQGVVVVDTGNNPPETRLLQNFIKSVTSRPVRYVIITQNHG